MIAREQFYGRLVLVNQADADQVPPGVPASSTISVRGSVVACHRCGQTTAKELAALPGGNYYCPACIELGRVATLDRFYHLPEPNQFRPPAHPLTWHGQLSPDQERVAEEVKEAMLAGEHRLLWAVTGAGKTEMIFPAIAAALARRKRVAIASPRVDVCLELAPRLAAAFAAVPQVVLQGQVPQPYRYCQLTICTTHQLLRFLRAFDLLVVDEVDAFPYARDPGLHYAYQRALKKSGSLLLMTATPDARLLRAVRRGQLTVSYLPKRYHGHPLPEPRLVAVGDWRRRLARGRLPPRVVSWVRSRLAQHCPFLLFLPRVADLTPVATALARALNRPPLVTVHAADPDRAAKVVAMRAGRLPGLLTTTILERGVTLKGIDVAVLGADDPEFSPAALVQMAGRVGRAADRPTGDVCFWLHSRTGAVVAARRQIRAMNNRGRHQ